MANYNTDRLTIGENTYRVKDTVSDYATNTALSEKQDKLIAGTNISIGTDGKTISATGGLPSGATAGDALIYNGIEWSKQSNYGYDKTITVSSPWDGNPEEREHIVYWTGLDLYQFALPYHFVPTATNISGTVTATVGGQQSIIVFGEGSSTEILIYQIEDDDGNLYDAYMVEIAGDDASGVFVVANEYVPQSSSHSAVDIGLWLGKITNSPDVAYMSLLTYTIPYICKMDNKYIEDKVVNSAKDEDGFGWTESVVRINWDGDTTGKDVLDLGDACFYRLDLPFDTIPVANQTSFVLCLDDYSASAILPADVITQYVANELYACENGDTSFAFLIARKDSSLAGQPVKKGLWLPKGGNLYEDIFCSSVILGNASTVHKINSKFLPDNILTTSAQAFTAEEKAQVRTNIDAYNKPADGIPATDLTSAIQTSLSKANSALQSSDIVDNVTSTSTTAPLSANQGRVLQTEITNLQSIGRFLAIWNCTTGIPTSEPSVSPYAYKTGDYYRIGVAGNRVPTGSQYVIGGTNYTTITDTVNVGDVYYYDGSAWVRQVGSGGGTVQDVQVNGTTVLSGGIANIPLATTSNAGAMSAQDKTNLANKVDKVSGKGLSTNDYTTTEKNKLSGIAAGAEVNVQSNWTETNTSSDAYIQNKPSTFPPSAHTHDDRYYTESEIDTKLSAKEATANKVSAWSTTTTNTNYPSEKLVKDSLDAKQDTIQNLSYVALSTLETTSNKVSSWSTTTTDAHYPSEKLVKTALDAKASSTHTHTAGTPSATQSVLTGVSSAGAVPTLGTAITADDITSWSAGSASISATPAETSSGSGIYNVTIALNYTAPSLSYTARSIPNVTSVGSMPTFNTGSAAGASHSHTISGAANNEN